MKYEIKINWEGNDIPFTKHSFIDYKSKSFFFRVNNDLIFKKRISIPIIGNEKDNTLFEITKLDDCSYLLESKGEFSDPYFDIEQKVLEKFNSMAMKAGMIYMDLTSFTSCPTCYMYKYINGNTVDLIYLSIPYMDENYDLSLDSSIPTIEIKEFKEEA